MIEVRVLDAEKDEAVIRGIRQAAFDDRWLDAEYHWKYLEGPHGPMRVFGAYDTEAREYAGVFSCFPRQFWKGSEIVELVQQADAAVHPRHQRKGVFGQLVHAVTRYAASCDAPFHFGFTNDLSAGAMAKLPGSSEDYSDRVFARPLGARNLFQQLATVPERVKPLATKSAAPLVRLVNKVKYRATPLGSEPVEMFEGFCDHLAQSWSSTYGLLVPRRTDAFMEWRIHRAPAHHRDRVSAIWITRDDVRVGYVVLYHEKQRDLLKIVDCLCDTQRVSLSEILAVAVRRGLAIGADGVVTNMAGPPHHSALRKAGFFPRNRVRTTLISTSAGSGDPTVEWYISPIDRDTRGGY